jgi:uncharacterized protein (TIRG00374 family)
MDQSVNESEVLGGRSFWRRVLTGLAFGIAVLAGVLVVADVRAVLPVLARFPWPLVPLVLTLTTGNYLLRFLKWELFLRWVGVRHLPRTTSLSIFLAGFAMSITPGKVGEWIKALLVAKLARVPMAPIVPVVAIERLTDGIAMLVLGLASAVLGTGWGWQPLVLLGVLVLVGLWLVQQERVVIPLLRLAERVPFARKRTDAIMTVYEAARELLAWRRLLLVSGMSIVSWSLECAALFCILVGFGLSPDGQLAAGSDVCPFGGFDRWSSLALARWLRSRRGQHCWTLDRAATGHRGSGRSSRYRRDPSRDTLVRRVGGCDRPDLARAYCTGCARTSLAGGRVSGYPRRARHCWASTHDEPGVGRWVNSVRLPPEVP